jgi:hypothetical protein
MNGFDPDDPDGYRWLGKDVDFNFNDSPRTLLPPCDLEADTVAAASLSDAGGFVALAAANAIPQDFAEFPASENPIPMFQTMDPAALPPKCVLLRLPTTSRNRMASLSHHFFLHLSPTSMRTCD